MTAVDPWMALESPHEYLAAQESAWRRLSPRRNRWAEVRAFDDRAIALEQRQAGMTAELQALHARLAAAPAADAEALADWQLAGARGTRPEPQAEALEREIATRQADYDSLTRAVRRTLEEKAEYVARHRKRLKRDAAKQVELAHARAAGLVDELERARAALVEAREESLWASLYPDEAAAESFQPQVLAGGRMEPVRRILGITTQLESARVFDALRADVDWARDAATLAQRARLDGHDQRDLHGATWADSPEGQERTQKERQAALARLHGEQGRTAAEWE